MGWIGVIFDLFIVGLFWPQIVICATSAAFDFNATGNGSGLIFAQQGPAVEAALRLH